MNEVISVIIPVYNVCEYLEECMKSVVDQTYRNLEIILVDDGSNDGSGIMCDEWARRDERIVVVHKENGGLSDARNAGLKVASGQLIGFIDSDDKIEQTMFEKLYHVLSDNQTDIACCNYDRFGDIEFTNPDTKQVIIYSKDEFFFEYMKYPRWFSPSACLKLYRKSVIKNLLFEYGVHYEDIMWTLRCADSSNAVAYLDESLYHYRCRQGSIITTGVTKEGKIGVKEITDHIGEFRKLEKFWQEKGNEVYADNAAKEYLVIALDCLHIVKKQKQRELYPYKPYLKEIIKSKDKLLRRWGREEKSIEKYLAGYSPTLYYFCVRVKEIMWDNYVKLYHVYKKYVKRG